MRSVKQSKADVKCLFICFHTKLVHFCSYVVSYQKTEPLWRKYFTNYFEALSDYDWWVLQNMLIAIFFTSVWNDEEMVDSASYWNSWIWKLSIFTDISAIYEYNLVTSSVSVPMWWMWKMGDNGCITLNCWIDQYWKIILYCT